MKQKSIYSLRSNLALIKSDSPETRRDQRDIARKFEHPAMKTTADLLARYGNPVTSRAAFEKKWMVSHTLPVRVPRLPLKIYMNRDIVTSFDSILLTLENEDLTKEIKSWDGCFNIRTQIGSTTISRHSFGIAMDINAAWNPLKGKVTWSEDFLNVWREIAGWICGADFHSRTDGMHFEHSAYDAF